MPSDVHTTGPSHAHALALHVGFSGSRNLGFAGLPEQEAGRRHHELVSLLMAELRALPGRLGLHDGYFLVGLSQIAIGADSVFSDACAADDVLHRVMLPQPRDGYLSAIGSIEPDFDAVQAAEATRRLEKSNVIQERVVSASASRRTRFHECSLEILRLADIAVTLQLDPGLATGVVEGLSDEPKPGGTPEFVGAAERSGKATLVCRFSFDGNGTLHWLAEWYRIEQQWPTLPSMFETQVTKDGFVNQIKSSASKRAAELKQAFERRMRWVIWTHVGATALAAGALAVAYSTPVKSNLMLSLIIAILLLELILLGCGYWNHRGLHQTHNTHQWAEARLAAEIARSAQTMGPGMDRIPVGNEYVDRPFAGQHTYLRALFDLPLPDDFRGLVRTLNVLHLQATMGGRLAEWPVLRDRYVRERLDTDTPKGRGQIPYFEREFATATRAAARAQGLFLFFLGLAFSATLVKLALMGVKVGGLAAVLSWLAIVMPVAAVAVMSVSINLDKEARKSTYDDMLRFLRSKRTALKLAQTEPDFLRLQAETEVKLLSEAINWYYRRRFVNPA